MGKGEHTYLYYLTCPGKRKPYLGRADITVALYPPQEQLDADLDDASLGKLDDPLKLAHSPRVTSAIQLSLTL